MDYAIGNYSVNSTVDRAILGHPSVLAPAFVELHML